MANLLTAPAPAEREHGTTGHARSWPAAWCSAGLHLAALAAVCLLVVRRVPPEPTPPPSFAMVMQMPPAREETLPAVKLAPATSSVAMSLAAPLPVSVAAPREAELHFPAHPIRRFLTRTLPTARPSQTAEAAPAPAARTDAVAAEKAAPAGAVSRDAEKVLEARIRQAVQEAVIYPAAARAMHMEGRTELRFDYVDGTVSQADVAASSSSAMLDRAALAALRRAALPRAPSEIGSRTLALLVWVDFRMVRQD